MKLSITTILLFLESLTYGQFRTDTTISKYSLDSMKRITRELKESNTKLNYELRLCRETYNIDTTIFKNDSAIINHVTKSGLLLRQEIKDFDNTGCQTYYTDKYFNIKEQVEFIEYWKLFCEPDTTTLVGVKFTGFRNSYERLQYDKKGRIILRVLQLSTPMTRRIKYDYTNGYKPKQTIEKISESEFWD